MFREVPPVRELERICGGEGRGQDEPRNVRFLYARLVRKLSIRITWVLLKLGFNADRATLLGIGVGLAGAGLLASRNIWFLLAGLALLQLSFVIDFSDGEIARYERSSGPAGAYLDWIGHYYLPAAITFALAWGAVRSGESEWVLLAAVVVALSLLRIPYSARDHVLLGLYRDDPAIRNDPRFVRAVLARQGGDPDLIDPADEGHDWRQGVEGSGALWRRYTNLGQLLVFPGYVNVVSLAVIADVLLTDAAPAADEGIVRAAALIALGAIHLAHQARATVQSTRILRGL